MYYRLLSKISKQYNHTGYADHLNLTSFPGQSLIVPGMGHIMKMSTFYTPLRGLPSPYAQNKQLPKSEEKLPKIDISDSQTKASSQTGSGSVANKVLESLNEGQKHKLEDNIYNAMTSPVIKVKKIKLEASNIVPVIKKAVKRETSNLQTGQGGKKTKKTHKFSVI